MKVCKLFQEVLASSFYRSVVNFGASKLNVAGLPPPPHPPPRATVGTASDFVVYLVTSHTIVLTNQFSREPLSLQYNIK